MNEQELYDHAIYLLAGKDYSSGDMAWQLCRLAENAEQITLILARLSDNGYLNNSRLMAHLFDKHIRKLHGPARIKQAFRQRGFSQELTEQTINNSGVDWYASAREARIRKFGETPPSDPKEKNKQFRYLQYKGYPMDMISEAFG